MWWGLIACLVFVYPVVEAVEQWRLNRLVRKKLMEMRKHAASGHHWDVTRGQWVR